MLLTNLAATLFLTGLVWVLQVVQLPLLSKIGRDEFTAYVRQHRRRNTILMTLPMLTELVTAIWIFRVGPLVLLAVIWIVTFVFYIPLHARLARGYDEALIRRLIAWNWVRTLCWTGRAGMLLWLVAHNRIHATC